MTAASFFVQVLNGMASASTLFLLASGLSLIFGVTRIVNFAHGSFYMLGAYVAWSLTTRWSGPIGFWGAVLASALVLAALGAAVEMFLLRRLYRAPDLFQLLATFALALILRDGVLAIWGAEDLIGPRAPNLQGALVVFGRAFPQYDAALIVIGCGVLLGLWFLLKRTTWGAKVRAATQDREMAAALGVNPSWLFTSVFALGAGLAGLGGALQIPREPASAGMDLMAIGDAFVVVVVGGMGSAPGAFMAALLIAQIKAICIALGQWESPWGAINFSKMTLVAEFLIMAVTLVLRPWGLMGRAPAAIAARPFISAPKISGRMASYIGTIVIAALVLSPAVMPDGAYFIVLSIDIFIAILFAASLYLILGPGGLESFGHAAYFGLGAYGAALTFKNLGAPMEAALALGAVFGGLGAALFGWFCVRLGGVYFAMLTLAFAQITWAAAFQWDGLTGGSNGLIGVWPSPWAAPAPIYYELCLGLCLASLLILWRILGSPFGLIFRAVRDNFARSEAIGVHGRAVQWTAFIFAGAFAGLAGALFAFSKGGVSPDVLGVSRSIDALVMVIFGSIEYLAGPVLGASAFMAVQDFAVRHVEYWRAVMGAILLLLVLAFPEGLLTVVRKQILRR